MPSPRSAAVLPIPPRESRRGAAGAAYRWLRGEILAGALPPGAPLSENEVAQRLGVSRTPVREAFIRLENEGLLTVTPQVGTTVAPIDLDAGRRRTVPARIDRDAHGRHGRDRRRRRATRPT